MNKLLMVLFLVSKSAFAGVPVVFNASCASGVYITAAQTQACFVNGSSVGSVSSFNLRTGAVTPQLSDYSQYFLQISNNLSDLTSPSTARTNLGLGTSATEPVGFFAQIANNLSDLANAATARVNLGLGTAATQASSFFLQAANNLSDLGSASTARTNLGLGSAATQASTFFLQVSNNLSDLASAATARANLGLGTAATQNSTAFDTSGAAAAAQAYSIQRANQTGTQLAATISDFATAVGLYNSATATALASTPSQCSGSQFATGITASGAANCATPSGGGTTPTTNPQHLYVSNNVTAAPTPSDSNPCTRDSQCLTISHAITVATAIPAAFSAPVIISVDPANGTPYTENLSFTQQGISLECNSVYGLKAACQLYGHVTINNTGTAGGGSYSSGAVNNTTVITGFSITPNDNTVAIQFSGSTAQSLHLWHDFVSTQAGTGSAITVNNSGTSSTVYAFETDILSNDSASATVAVTAGRFWDYGNGYNFIANSLTGGSLAQGGGSSILNLVNVTGSITQSSNTSSITVITSSIASGSASCIAGATPISTGVNEVLNVFCTSSATYAYSGGMQFISTGLQYAGTTTALDPGLNGGAGYQAGMPTIDLGIVRAPSATISGVTASSMVKTNASHTLVAAVAGTDYITPGSLIGVRNFTSGTSYTPTAGTGSIYVLAVGGGGGGGYAVGGATGAAAGSGGSGGGCVGQWYTNSGSPTFTMAIGAAGAGGVASSSTAATSGTASTFTNGTTAMTADFGNGGVSMASQTTNATNAGGTFDNNNSAGLPAYVGVNGGPALVLAGQYAQSGLGGTSCMAAGAPGLILVATGNTNGQGGHGRGGGGAGGASYLSATGGNGGAGIAGEIYVWEYK